MLDFNADQPPQTTATTETRKADLLAQVPALLTALFPAGQRQGERFVIGNTAGEPGDSLEVALQPPKAGLWYDHATGEGGDLFALIAAADGLSVTSDFPAVLAAGERRLGRVCAIAPSAATHSAARQPRSLQRQVGLSRCRRIADRLRLSLRPGDRQEGIPALGCACWSGAGAAAATVVQPAGDG